MSYRCTHCYISNDNHCTCCCRYAERIVALHEEHRNKKKAGKLPTEAVAVLKAWWDANQANPYPSEEIKKQVGKFFYLAGL